MYLIVVILLLLFITFYPRMREGLDEKDPEDVLNKSTILTTETEIQIPNHVSGTRGKDLQFGGNILLEKDNALELGAGVNKGDNAGKIRYNKDKLEIFGAGEKNTPYKMKLWDNVEVGRLLQVNESIHLGTQTKDDESTLSVFEGGLNITGRKVGDVRKVNIWDEVEVGKLLSKNGIEVKGPFQAYNDLNVDGKIVAKKGMTVTGDVEINGNIKNEALNSRLAKLESNTTTSANANAGTSGPNATTTATTNATANANSGPTAGPSGPNAITGPALSELQLQIKSLSEQVTELKSRPQSQGTQGPPSGPQTQGPGPQSGPVPQAPAPMDSGALTTLQTQVTTLSNEIAKTNAATSSLNTSLANAITQVKSETNNQIAEKLKSLTTTSSGNAVDASQLALMKTEYDIRFSNISDTMKDWNANKTKLMKWSSIDPTGLDLRPNGILAAFSKTNMSFSKLVEVANSTLDFRPNGRMSALSNAAPVNYDGAISNLTAYTTNMSRDLSRSNISVNLLRVGLADVLQDKIAAAKTNISVKDVVADWYKEKKTLLAARDGWENASNRVVYDTQFTPYKASVATAFENASQYQKKRIDETWTDLNNRVGGLRGEMLGIRDWTNGRHDALANIVTANNGTAVNGITEIKRDYMKLDWDQQSSKAKAAHTALNNLVNTINGAYLPRAEANNTYLKPPGPNENLTLPAGINLGNNTTNKKWSLTPGEVTLAVRKY